MLGTGLAVFVLAGAVLWRFAGDGAAGWWRSALGLPVRVDGPVVLISVDTLRADHLPVYGYRGVATPTIDRLAAEAVVFERAYAHSPQTLPSHASLFTGRLPFQHGVRDNLGFTVKPEELLLAERLKAQGFETAAAVSAYVLRRQVGLDQGFDLYDDQMPPASPEVSIAQVQRDGSKTLEVIERWLSARSTRRMFLFVHLYEPHKPYAPPPRFGQYAPYDGEIAYADELVGRLLQGLKDRRLYDPALIVFVSDHGEGLGDHGEQEHGVFLYDETIRVPLLVKLPGGRSAGRRVRRPVQLTDVTPTILDLVGAQPDPTMHGRSLRPLLEGRTPATPEEGVYAEALYARYHFGWSELYSLTDARYHYIKAPREELYDLATDPDERRNLALERPQVRVAMRAALERLLAGSRLDRPGQVSDEERERLQALGYVGMQVDLEHGSEDEGLADPKDKIAVLEKYRTAVAIAGERRFAEAIALFREILAENPTMADVWQQLGHLQLRAGRFEDAVVTYRRLVELKPQDPNAVLSVATALLRLRRFADARAHAELAVRLADEDAKARATAHEVLARIGLATNDPAMARQHAARAHEADPTLPLPLYVQGRVLHAEGRYAEALPLFLATIEQVRARSLTLNELHFYTADTLARLGRSAEAEAQFREEIRLFPHNARAWASLALLYRSLGRDAECEATVAGLLQAVPTPEGYGLAARVWTIVGEPARAAAVRAEAMRRFAGDPTLARALNVQ